MFLRFQDILPYYFCFMMWLPIPCASMNSGRINPHQDAHRRKELCGHKLSFLLSSMLIVINSLLVPSLLCVIHALSSHWNLPWQLGNLHQCSWEFLLSTSLFISVICDFLLQKVFCYCNCLFQNSMWSIISMKLSKCSYLVIISPSFEFQNLRFHIWAVASTQGLSFDVHFVFQLHHSSLHIVIYSPTVTAS